MYRIHFDHRIGRFVIQVLVFGLFWRDIAKSSDTEPVSDRLSFAKLVEAENYIQSIGLARLYKNKSANEFSKYMENNDESR